MKCQMNLFVDMEPIRYSLFTIHYLLQESNSLQLVEHGPAFDSICDDCTELLKLLTASVKTAKVES